MRWQPPRQRMKTESFTRLLVRYFSLYTAGFGFLLISLAILEHEGFPRFWLGYLFLFSTIVVYAFIGVFSRTSDVNEYYVAGRRVPALFNGMATAADWISAASFMGLAGGLYLQGFDGLAYIMGWTGGFCLVALLIAPYLRKFGQYTVPDFLSARYGGENGSHTVRLLAVIATLIISFTYVVAQIYGVGLITSRFTGIDFSVGIFLGLASILVCSFLGGMRAITWTQIAQYIILLIAFMIPVSWLAMKQTGIPVPQIAYSSAVEKLTAQEKRLADSKSEQQVRALYRERAEQYDTRLATLPRSWDAGLTEARRRLQVLQTSNASLIEIKAANRALAEYPKSPEEARRVWLLARDADLARSQPLQSHTQPFPAPDRASSDIQRNNFLALIFCLMLGTAALPHVLVRSYTTPSVPQARTSVFWALFFVLLLYTAFPALAVLVKYEIYSSLVGSSFAELPGWVSYWANIDKLKPLISITDINQDGLVQLAEIVINGDMVMLATPEIAGMPYVISALIAAGALAAALSTADGLLLTIASALSHDTYYKMVNPEASSQKQVTIAKLILLVVTLLAAYIASFRSGDILSMVSIAFSLAASTLFPALVLGIFWKRANQEGAIAGMLTGFFVCLIYLVQTIPALGGSSAHQWFHIAPASAGVFGVPAGLIAMIVVSLLTPPPGARVEALVERLRSP
jgi:cation/acetate symporter